MRWLSCCWNKEDRASEGGLHAATKIKFGSKALTNSGTGSEGKKVRREVIVEFVV